jgi:hypothetical protein
MDIDKVERECQSIGMYVDNNTHFDKIGNFGSCVLVLKMIRDKVGEKGILVLYSVDGGLWYTACIGDYWEYHYRGGQFLACYTYDEIIGE